MLNRVILIGRLTRDPEMRSTGSGVSVVNFTLAVNRRFSRSGEGQQGEQTDFIDIVAWRQLAELCNQYLSKGRLVAVEGRLQVRKWQASDGTNRRSYEVVADNVQFLESRKAVEEAQSSGETATEATGTSFPPDEDYEDANDVFNKKELDESDSDDPLIEG